MTNLPVVGIVGLGAMGLGMAQASISRGCDVVGHDIDREQGGELSRLGGAALESGAAVAANCEVLILSLPSASALASVAAEIASTSAKGPVVIEAGTFHLEDKLAARHTLGQANIVLLDTPVSGTSAQAREGSLVVYSSGPLPAFEIAKPVLDLISSSVHYLGEFGNGSKMKYVANLLVALHILATAEAHLLGAASGLDPVVVQEAISQGVASSRMFEIRGPMMTAQSYEPLSKLELMLKDVDVISAYAQSLGVTTHLLEQARSLYADAVDSDLGHYDTAAIIELLRSMSGSEISPD